MKTLSSFEEYQEALEKMPSRGYKDSLCLHGYFFPVFYRWCISPDRRHSEVKKSVEEIVRSSFPLSVDAFDCPADYPKTAYGNWYSGIVYAFGDSGCVAEISLGVHRTKKFRDFSLPFSFRGYFDMGSFPVQSRDAVVKLLQMTCGIEYRKPTRPGDLSGIGSIILHKGGETIAEGLPALGVAGIYIEPPIVSGGPDI